MFNNIENDVKQVKLYLTSHHMHADDEWLTGCVEYLRTDETGTRYSKTDLNTLAREQWLLNDLREICPGSLPGDLASRVKTVLTGQYVLQLNYLIDVGTPAYQQLQKYNKVNTENIEATINNDDKVPSHRMIKLYLTDGVQDITAIEYKTMRNLRCDLTPGCKILIKGPVDCRRGALLLEEKHIEILGGEVESLVLTHSAHKVLEGIIGQQAVDRPAEPHNDSARGTFPQQDEPLTISTTSYTSRHNYDSGIATSDASSRPNHSGSNRPTAQIHGHQVQAEEEFVDDIDYDYLASIEEQMYNADIPHPSKRSNPVLINTREINNVDVLFSNPAKKPKIMASSSVFERSKTKNKMPKKEIMADDIIDLDENCEDDFPEIDMTEMNASFDDVFGPVNDENIELIKYPINVSPLPFIYLKQINELDEKCRNLQTFYVKGQIQKLLSKLSINKSGWTLACTIVDGSGAADVEFTSSVLTKLIGYSPLEMSQMKKEMGKKPELKQKAMMALNKAKETLQILNCILELTSEGGTIRITSLLDFTDEHTGLMRERMLATNVQKT